MSSADGRPVLLWRNKAKLEEAPQIVWCLLTICWTAFKDPMRGPVNELGNCPP